jgi:amino acid adenylation domain-containing protein
MRSVATLTELTPAERRELLNMARARDLVGDRSGLPPIEPAAREGRLPLSFAQERLWFIDRLEPGSAVYNISVAWRLEGALDPAALERALGEIVRRHEALRTVFAEVDGSPVQLIAPFAGFSLPVEDLSGLGEADREAAVSRRAGEEARRPFDLSAGPLFRAALLRLGSEEHVLLLSVHHIVGDGLSMGVLYRELSVLYEAYREGRTSPLPEPAVQYADYAVWQREHLRDGVLEGKLAYWRERLAGAPALLELPSDHPRPAVQTYRGAHERIELPLALLERLQALGRSEGASLYMTLLGAFQVLLGKYSGSDDIVVGSPIAGRPRREVEETIGFFVNTLVLRTDLSGSPSFREVLGRVREATLGAYEHQDVPFEKLVAELQPERSLSHSPLFQVMFAQQNAVERGVALAGLEVSEAGAELESAKFDLSLMAKATAQGLRVGLNYSTDLFERGTVERMLGHLARVLEQVASDADVRLSQLELLGPAERALVLEEWNGTAAEVPADRCIHELFEAQAARTPDAVAVVFEDASLTYAELNARANRLAHHLRGCGVGAEVRVGVLMERSLEMVVSLLAVLKAAGAYVPLDPGLPAERLAYMLDDSAVPLVLVQAALRGAVPAREGVEVLAVDALAERLAAEPAENPALGAGPDSLAYVIYTSGSTGRPKGVMNQHRGVVNRLVWMQAHFGIGADDVVLQKTPFGFDVSVWEFFWPLQQGARLVVARPDGHRDPAYLRDVIEREGVTTLHFVPSMLQPFVEAVEAGRCPSLHHVVCSGEALSPALVERFYDRFAGPVVLTNLYGPTEAAVDVSCWTCSREDADGVVPIGRPVSNTQLYVLDSSLKPVPVGVPGELYIGGVQVARGYQGRAAMTAERFVPDPFSAEGGARLYRTGDRARWRADGAIEYLGRLDFQVKVRGFRIELGEIEAVLRQHESVTDSAVLARADAGEQRLVAYVVGDAGVEELRAHVRRTLPEYMLPSAFVFLDALPLTANGKLDRKALPAPDFAPAEERYVAPRTPVEEVLAEIWAEVLRLGRVGVTDSFFELGGHSLLVTRVVARVRDVFAIELPLRALFEGPTVAELAGRVEAMRRAGLPVLPPVVPIERTGPLPLSFAQERLWFIDQLEPGSVIYNVPVARRLEGALDMAALERALGEIVRRHESLRTVFAERDGAPVQVIAPFGGFALPVEDLSGLDEADREAAVRRRASEEARRAFDLSAGPLFRAALLRLDAEDHVLLLSMHHVVSDGWSMGVLFRELSALYAAYREGGESPLPELAVQYADYAVWQREQLAGEVLDAQLAYWKERLTGAPALLELPTDHPRPAVQTYRGASVPVELSVELLERLQRLGRSEGATLYMTLLGAFQVLLSKYGGGEDVVVGSPIAGRTRKEVEELIGFFVNTLVLRTDLSGDPSFREVLGRVREATLGAYEHQELPFEKLVAELQPERSSSHSPLFQVMFLLQNAEGGGVALPGLEVSGAGAAMEIAKFDLSLELTATAQGLRGGLNYSTDLFERGTVERMIGRLQRLLEQVAADADVRLSQLELLGGPERALVLQEWNRTEAEYPADRCIHELFEAQAARTPDAVAIDFQGETLSYGALNRRANQLAHQLAHHLAGLGVGAEVRVGICLERGAEMVVSVLAVLKAGGAYVPLDPAYPAERLAFLLADSAVPVLVTQESLRAALPAGDAVAVVSVDGDGARIAAESAENPALGVSSDHLAYVIYTSGSTGTPKGVMVPHRGVPNLAYAQARRFGIDATSRVLQFASFSFDAAVAEVFDALLTGATLVMAPREELLPGAELLETLRRGRVTVATLPPSVLAVLPPDDLPELRTVVSAGEAVDAATVERWSGGRAFVNAYGPTETTVCATAVRCEVDERAPSIGRALENVRVYVLDAAGRPAPLGVPGELYVGGVGVARGYLGRPGLTAERFVPDPFGGETGARLYRTGDRVRWRADGTLEYLGRLDEQVKVRGFRIEPGEIEGALRRSEGVADCVVVARNDVPGGWRLVAYVVGAAEADELREHLRRSLPEYMVPAAFVMLDAFPLTPNGKLDRKALPAPGSAPAQERYVAPRTPVEEVLAEIWAETLRLERVGVTESFFALGGHSLLATRVVSRVRQVFGVEVPLRALFDGPTVAELAGRVEEMRRAGLPVLPPVVPTERTGALPLSFAQERLWFLDRLEPGNTTYNIPGAWRLGGALDEAALQRALGEIVRRHESLRTVFREVDDLPVQVIAPFRGFALPVQDLSDLNEADREAALKRRAGEEARRVFDLSAGPLFRAALLRLGEEDHALLLSMHHVVSDGWSMGVLFRELSALYEAYREGGESLLPELPVQYADYAVWQREQLAGEVLDRQLSYWRERLAGAPELLELPTDHPRPAAQTYCGATVPVELSPELLERLQAVGRSEGATLYMTLLSAFQVLLSRYGGGEDVVVGSPIAGRTRAEVEELIGFFVNTLVLRTDLSGDPSFRETLRRVREATLGAYAHQEVPFEKLVAELQPERSLSHSPLFQVMFTMQDAGGGESALPGLSVSGVGAELASAKFDLSLTLTATAQGLRGGLNYSTDLFERGTVERMLGHLERVLEQVAADADVRLSQLELLGEAERALVLDAWNRTDAEYPADRCIHELFEAQVEHTPDAVAVSFEGEQLTYAALNARANRLAHHLRTLGVGPDARVAICVERAPEMVAALLAILKAGGAYVPLDPAYPADRLRYMLEDSAPAALVTQSSLAGSFAGLDVPVVELDAPAAAWAEGPETNPAHVELTPDHLAYVIYTSGSTGRPKGVMVGHRSLVNHTAWQAEAFGIGARDTVLQRTSISFDASVWELWTPLATGARMLLISSDTAKDAGAIGRAVEEGGVTIAQFVPTLLQAVLGALPAGSSLPCRTLFCGGEPLSAALVEEARSAGVGEVVNLYGPTEATIDSTWHSVPAEDGRAPAIGRPIANARMYVLDARGAAAPVGVAGELYVGGAGVARGYLGRAALTAERFVPDPFATEPGARLYRTGDVGRWRVDGTLEFLGRTDFQVKVRGFRIELGEIEAALLEHEGVRECAVVVRADAGETRVVAYVAGDVETDVLRAHLRRSLPDYMVPGVFVVLEALPLTPNGKLDRKALPAPEYAAEADRYVAPRTPVEEVLAGIWAETLRLERVGVEESFFDLGGHSLLATRVISRVRQVLGVEVPLRALFEGPTVAELAGRVEEMRRAELPVLPPVVPTERTGPLPLSFAQERLWFLHQMEPEGTRYNMPWPSRLRGHLDASALERGLGELVRRHEALRTTFRPVEQGAVQIVHPAQAARLPVLDLTGLPPEDREPEARRLAREDAERPFDLERGPLLRATLVRLSDEEHVLLLTMHHIVSDGWSMGVLFRELLTLYEALSASSGAAPQASPLPPLAVQYADFAVWQRGWLQGEVLRGQIDWWRERLGGAPPALELPTDRPRPAVASSHGGSHGFRIPEEITRGLRALARREGATLYMVTHAALDLLLSRWSGQEDLVVGSPIAGRTQMGTEGLIGFFVNTLALRIDLSGDPSFQELVRRVRKTALGAYSHQDLPFERLVEEVAPERGLSHTPLFQVMFALQNADSGGGAAIAGLRREPFGNALRTVRFDLELDLREVGEEMFGSLRFRTDLFDAVTMERFAAQYGVVLAAAAASPEERLSRLAILPAEEARTLLAYGSGPARENAGSVPVHRLFAAQAARTPRAPAVLFEGESLTYAELDARAERLARRLRGLGLGVGTAVAVCLERGPGVLVALLGVWKAGGVYLPLDPAHPAERLSFLLRDSGAALVVTEPALAGRLADRAVEVVLLDDHDRAGVEEDGAAEVQPGDLAYLIYTSGSTGTPKAVMVEHAQLTHTLRASQETLRFASGDVVAALASTSFDISLLELLKPLLTGGAVRVVPQALVRDPEELVGALADVTVLHAVPALMRQVVEVVRDGRMLPSLRLLLVGGDTVPPDLLEDMREIFPDAQTVVLYGPTEATIICATYAVPAEGSVAGHPLGRPLPGVRLAVRGPRGELSPVGVPGEVWISGGGVTRGYLRRPELNAEKFVGAGTERAYRTGDRARWRTDGVLEFLGRADEQVKVRGFRIEPGEVEAVLREQPGVREAVVLAREDAPGDRRLVAYVVPGTDGVETAGRGKEQVSEWETLFDDTYAQDKEEEDPALALKGWNSSYTGEPIPREEMRAWAEHTVARILALRPERVLEVGAGTGLLLFRVAPHVRAYHATDFSGVALEHIRRHAGGLPQVSLAEREADDLAEYAGAGFDVVVINSVAQYFPDLDYLLRVLDGAAAALRPGGRIFVGDLRSLPLAGAFHASVELARASEGLPTEQLQARVRRGMAEEQELLIDPALFEAVRMRIQRLDRVEVQVKRGEYDNEVSRFRYDVVLHLDADIAGAADPAIREWGGEDAAGLRALAEGSASALLVRGVPDARVREHVRTYELVSAGGEAADAAAVRALAARDADGIAPEALFAIASELAREIEVRPGASGTLDVLFHPAAGAAHFPAAVDAERPWESYANDPQWGRRMRALVPALREAARARLPEYMVPSAFVVLESFPVTPNGKVDRGALPAPDTPGSSAGTYVAPRTAAEERMAEIWAEVLGVERVGAEDHFFDLGGHSLLATRVVSRVRDAFAIELPLRALFEGPTVAELAGRVEEMRRAELPALPPVVPVPRDGSPLPLSFAQERLWFIDRLDPESNTYNMPMAWRLGGALDVRALERSVGEVVRRHEVLRTVFAEVNGSPVQVIAPFRGFALPVEDLSGWNEADREAAVKRRAREEAQRPFDLAAGPLFRAALLRLGDEDHVLLLSMHHIVSDGWSMGVLHRELSALYAAYREGRESPLPELAVQYADYAVWQRERLEGEVLDRQLAYWKERLAGAPELLELPTDHPRPAMQTYRGANVPVKFSLELLERLQALGRSEGTTLYMVLLGAFQLLLSKYSGSDDIVVGSPIAGRTRKELEELIGFFVNTLVLRTDLSGDPSFREVLGRAREATLGAYEHQEVPFERLVAELQPERSLSHTPLFQVIFALQNAENQGGALPGLEVSPVGAAMEVAKFDLSLTLSTTAQGLRGGLDYSTDLFERGTVDRMLGHLERVLEQVAADADVRLSQLELLGEAEREQVLEVWNDTDRGSCGPPAHALIAEWARRTPEAVALLHGREAVTFGELNRRASVLARHLRELGVGPETPVGLCMERTPELLVGILGIWKAGGAYVPLDPGYPAERLGWIVSDAALPVVVATESTAGVLPEHGATLVLVDQLPETTAEAAPEVPAFDAGLAYVIYTSGSTGRPKGVLVQHGSLANLLAAMRDEFGVGERDVTPALASYAFDIWLLEALLPLISGGAVRMVARERVVDVPALLEEIADVTLMHSVPALMQQVVQAERETPRLGRLRRAFVGGDRVAPGLLAEMREVFPGATAHVLYGPTEATILASVHSAPRDGRVEGHPIGGPLGNVRLYVCDAVGKPQPAGVPGELLIGGAGVARGYLGRAAMTAERFIPDPFSPEPGARLYRTGDRVRWRADGTVEFLGRTDFQVKVRGFRIEPGEIETVLRRHVDVREALVMVREDQPGELRLVAYVAGAVEVDALREHLRNSVPEYMVPAAFVVMEQLPLSPNGKLDRKALPAPELVPGDTSYVAPRRPLEATLAGIWAEVLGRDRVGVKENFFDLGGHSLLLVKVQARLGEALDRKIPIVDLFRFSTVAALAAHLGGEVEGAGGPQASAEGRRRRGRDRAAVRRALAGQSGGTTLKGDDK